MSQVAEREILRKFPTTLYRAPSYLEENQRLEAVPEDSTAAVIAHLRTKLDTTVFRLLVTAESKDQFSDLVRELFPDYVEVSGAISTLVRLGGNDQPPRVDEAFTAIKESVASADWLFESPSARDEATFCLDTLHRAHFLAQDVVEYINRGVLSSDCKSYQSAIAEEWWSLLHLRCILFAIQHKIRPTYEVFLCLMDGLRHCVMSYGFAQAAMESKYQSDYRDIDFSSLAPDAEDEYLANEADREYSFLQRQMEQPTRHQA